MWQEWNARRAGPDLAVQQGMLGGNGVGSNGGNVGCELRVRAGDDQRRNMGAVRRRTIWGFGWSSGSQSVAAVWFYRFTASGGKVQDQVPNKIASVFVGAIRPGMVKDEHGLTEAVEECKGKVAKLSGE